MDPNDKFVMHLIHPAQLNINDNYYSILAVYTWTNSVYRVKRVNIDVYVCGCLQFSNSWTTVVFYYSSPYHLCCGSHIFSLRSLAR